MNTIIDILALRRPVLNYVSPPICPVIVSASGSAVIVLHPITPKLGPIITGIDVLNGQIILRWSHYTGAICFTIYHSLASGDVYSIVAECVPALCPEDPNTHCFDVTEAGDGCFRVSAITLDGESELSEPACIPVLSPQVRTLDASDVVVDGARLNGEVSPRGTDAEAYFQWGLDTTYGNSTAPQPVGEGFSFVNVNEVLTGLLPSTEYHFRVVASNAGGTDFGEDRFFVTS